ncbi:MAG: sigma-70 family RNA polymerase sigma factor, partial [Schwartzia sp.]|nr:sigma-70 family RNA polymerase sigma factor [Schwartzia sp. (in: firmicutes)]
MTSTSLCFTGVADGRDAISAFEDADSFCTALAAFPEREQKILSLYYVDGLTLRAIGAKLGMKANHVSVVK